MLNITAVTVSRPLGVSAEENIGVPGSFGLSVSEIPVFFSGFITKKDAKFMLDGKLTAELIAECALCLREVRKSVSIEVSEVFSKAGDCNEADEWPMNGGEIDLYPVLRSNLLMAIPAKIVCKGDCKGLCPSCGRDLNEGNCGCDDKKTE